MNGATTDPPSQCHDCPRRCGADRRAGRSGFCRLGDETPIAWAGLHFGEEPPISGTNGSGTIFFAGCNLRCVYCQNHAISTPLSFRPFREVTPEELASEMLRLQDEGAHNINFVSPSHVVFRMARAVETARRRGLTIPVVYNSNGYDSPETLRTIRGLVDIYLPDIKYMDDSIALRFSRAVGYTDMIGAVLAEMLDQVGHLETDERGIAVRGLLVRHLVLPGQVENSRKCLRVVAALSPRTSVSILSQYSPRHRACSFPPLDRPITDREYDAVLEEALDLGLENAFVQELDSRENYLPDFTRENPFDAGAAAARRSFPPRSPTGRGSS